MPEPVPDPFADIDDRDCDLAEPYAAPMCESLRAFGYGLPSAIADLIDNSIFAQAENVWVDFDWDGENSTISVADDGNGMSEDVLVEAMRPGSRNPLETRDPKDLGRYGLGLKTASFSQCRVLSVRSKPRQENPVTRRWDLNFVAKRNKWLLLRAIPKASERHLHRFDGLKHGTIVLWEEIDRITKGLDVDNPDHKRFFLNRIEGVEQHLAMVFHRFIDGPRRLKLHVNGNKIEAWDPFLRREKATQQIADERIRLFQSQISVVPYVLPHISKLSPDKHRAAAGIRGWNLHQGFYIYRNERLLVAGDWLGLGFSKEEHFKLARIQLDIPNSMDHEWEIDVTKSKARPPDALRKDLKHIAQVTRSKASDIYRHRGKVLARSTSEEFIYTWQRLVRGGKYFYQVNRKHPLVQAALAKGGKQTEALLRTLEETVPTTLIAITNSEDPDKHSSPFESGSQKEVNALLQNSYEMMRASGTPHVTAADQLRVMEPFDRFPEIVEAFFENLGDPTP